MNKISLQQVKSYLTHPFVWLSAGLLPCLLALSHYFSAQKELKLLEKNALFLKRKKEWATLKQERGKKILSQLKTANRDYVETYLQNMVFLQPEIKKLQALLHSDPHNGVRKQRLEHLQNGKNALQFTQQHFRMEKGFQEVDVIQEYPVEMNTTDLKRLLANIENKAIGPIQPEDRPPYFIITNFELLKKPLVSNEETFVVKLKLIKREIIHE